jgi:lysozyme
MGILEGFLASRAKQAGTPMPQTKSPLLRGFAKGANMEMSSAFSGLGGLMQGVNKQFEAQMNPMQQQQQQSMMPQQQQQQSMMPQQPPSTVPQQGALPQQPTETMMQVQPEQQALAASGGISNTGLNFIKQHEGFRATPYKDYSQYSVGYGTRAPNRNMRVNKAQANEMLQKHVNKDIAAIKNAVKVPLSQNQLDSLSSFTYNVGRGWLKGSSVIRSINDGDFKGAARNMKKWNKAGGKVHPGLVRRRRQEAKMFLGY